MIMFPYNIDFTFMSQHVFINFLINSENYIIMNFLKIYLKCLCVYFSVRSINRNGEIGFVKRKTSMSTIRVYPGSIRPTIDSSYDDTGSK